MNIEQDYVITFDKMTFCDVAHYRMMKWTRKLAADYLICDKLGVADYSLFREFASENAKEMTQW